jgi:hypothetical protein
MFFFEKKNQKTFGNWSRAVASDEPDSAGCAIFRTMSTEPLRPEDFATLYRQAFEDFGASALWSSRPVRDPTPEDAMAITRTLRFEGDLRARQLAEQIEHACRNPPR